ncbi:MAG: DUF6036 family nucleotidyltransferase [Nitrospiria bacterium]
MGRTFKGFGTVFQALTRSLRRYRISYMIVGGWAANYHGMPRATYDIDLVVKLDGQGLPLVIRMMKRLGFDLRPEDAEQILRIGNRITVTSSSHPYRIDLWLIRTAYDQVAFDRRKKATLLGVTVWFASPEDTILSKLGADRAKDIEDASSIVAVQKTRLDWGYLHHWSKLLNVEDKLERLRREHSV